MSSDQPPVRKTEAWKHQAAAFWFAGQKPGALLSLDMGCGKTKVAVDILVNRGCSRVLILCPKAVVPVWRKEMDRHCPTKFTVGQLDQESCKAKLLAAQNLCVATPASQLLVLVCNYESAWRDELGKWLLAQQWDMVALDESHRVKDPQGRTSLFCAKLAMRAKRRLCLTGTPMPHDPLDLFAQYRFLEPAIFGTSYTEFRSRYAVCDRMFKSKVRSWINQDELQARMALIAFRVQAHDVLDLPEKTHVDVPVTLGPRARRVYDELEAELVAEVGAAGECVTVPNALVKLLRLQQIACGFVPVETVPDDDVDGSYSPTTQITLLDNAKAEALEELLDDLGNEPAVVFCRFKTDLARVRTVAHKLGRRYGELSGRFADLTPQATMSDETDVLGVQVQSGGAGVDLSRAAHAFFYSVGCISPGQFDQCVARLHRPGQTRPVRYYHLVASGTVDETVYRALQDKRDVIEAVLEVLKNRGA